MATTTPNLGLTKPAGTEKPDISVINDNMDKIDTAVEGKSPKNHTHNYAGSASAGGSATSSEKLDGFVNSTEGFWGPVNSVPKSGTCIKRMNTPNGGGLLFSEHDAMVDEVIDGHYYQDEGKYMCLDTNNFSDYTVELGADITD